MTKYELIQDAVSRANAEISYIDPATFEIGGFTSPKIRHLMNNLGTISTNYLEIGCHRGATLTAAFSNNPRLNFVAIDNFSEFEDGTVEDELRQNIKRFGGTGKFIKGDCWTADLGDAKFDLYLYDGAHDVESQERAITHFEKHFADEVILCVDDFDWNDVRTGTQIGGMELNADYDIRRCFYATGAEGWHNGFAVFLLTRKK